MKSHFYSEKTGNRSPRHFMNKANNLIISLNQAFLFVWLAVWIFFWLLLLLLKKAPMRRNGIERKFSILRICLQMCFRFDAIWSVWMNHRGIWLNARNLIWQENGHFGVDGTIHIYISFFFLVAIPRLLADQKYSSWYALWFTPHIFVSPTSKIFSQYFVQLICFRTNLKIPPFWIPVW